MKTEPTEKSSLRKRIRRKRAGIGISQRNRRNAAINSQLVRYSRQTGPSVAAAYMAFDGEPDLMPGLEKLGDSGVRLALPVVEDAPGGAIITFRHWSKEAEMQQNRYGINEPAGTKLIGVGEIDLVLLPLVAWDRTGGRLGMGAGFYDRLFQPYSDLDKPVRMGVGYELQNVDRIPRDPWDIGLHGVLTENGWFTCTD